MEGFGNFSIFSLRDETCMCFKSLKQPPPFPSSLLNNAIGVRSCLACLLVGFCFCLDPMELVILSDLTT